VADFGLAKFTSDTNTHVSTRVMGTFGYVESYGAILSYWFEIENSSGLSMYTIYIQNLLLIGI
jgi:hypothetical protein